MHGRSRKRKRNLKRVFELVDGEIHTLSDQQVLGLRNEYSRVYQRYVKPTITITIELRTEQVMPKQPPLPPSKGPILI